MIDLVFASKKVGKKLRRLPRRLVPDHIKRAYYKKLIAVLTDARNMLLDRLMPELPIITKEAGFVKDAIEGSVWSYADTLGKVFDDVNISFYQEMTEDSFRRMAEDVGQETAAFNRAALGKQFKQVLNVDVFQTEPWLEQMASAFTKTNVGLIKSIPEKYFQEIEDLVMRKVQAGGRYEEIRDILEEEGRGKGRFDISKNRAKLIARDQVGKFDGNLTRMRQTELGISRYIWRTSQDERVRPSHSALNGKFFSWDKPPDVGHPGQDIQCRCTADPIIEDVLGMEFEGDTAEARAQAKKEGRYFSRDEWIADMTAEEKAAFNYWTTKKNGCTNIRKYQAGEMTDKQKKSQAGKTAIKNAAIMEQAFKKAPRYNGVIYRGIGQLDETSVKSLIQKGTIVADKKFSSWSKDPTIGIGFAKQYTTGDKNYMVFKVNATKNAYDIDHSALSMYLGEQEVITTPEARYRVLDVTKIVKDSGIGYAVELEEI